MGLCAAIGFFANQTRAAELLIGGLLAVALVAKGFGEVEEEFPVAGESVALGGPHLPAGAVHRNSGLPSELGEPVVAGLLPHAHEEGPHAG